MLMIWCKSLNGRGTLSRKSRDKTEDSLISISTGPLFVLFLRPYHIRSNFVNFTSTTLMNNSYIFFIFKKQQRGISSFLKGMLVLQKFQTYKNDLLKKFDRKEKERAMEYGHCFNSKFSLNNFVNKK